ncbi:hypothetical protein [Aureimonas populi]|uniref:DUF4169 domain-containing protein n=1 Tax=Aureimonas populi TaxID=1701758 RepID=A0ABW5CNS8_9HYPH|nr:hypothetical protein [Aureimonas populi]
MARKPNFNFERQERDRAKAAKKAAKSEARVAKRGEDDAPGDEADAPPATQAHQEAGL